MFYARGVRDRSRPTDQKVRRLHCIGLTPILATVDYRAEEVGRCLAGELLALIEGKVNFDPESHSTLSGIEIIS
jgi:hypothetical protein